jgi:hypothetical protein
MIADLDRLISDPVMFKFRGKRHFIKPISTEVFLAVLTDLARVHEIQRLRLKVDEGTMTKVMAKLFMDVCETLTYDDVAEMTYAQRASLFQNIIEIVKGSASEGSQAQKKSPLPTTA